MDWMIEGVNYWHNPNCPREYLEGSLVRLIDYVEDVQLPIDHFKDVSLDYLIDRVAFYEYLSDK